MDWTTIIASVVGTGGAIFSGFKAFSVVKEGEVGVLLTWGKAKRDQETGLVKLYGPGARWVFPFAQRFECLRVKKNIINYENLTITLKNNLTYRFNAMIIYDVIEEPLFIENILFKMENRDSYVGLMFKKAIQQVLHKSEELDIKNASTKLRREVSKYLEPNGWLIDDIDIMLFTETAISQSLRGIDYRIQKALEYRDDLSSNILCAALGVSPVINLTGDADLEEASDIIEEEV